MIVVVIVIIVIIKKIVYKTNKTTAWFNFQSKNHCYKYTGTPVLQIFKVTYRIATIDTPQIQNRITNKQKETVT
jgi:ABC-type arginine/histidine transport system permease subunit